MSKDLLNILSNSNKEIDNQLLMDYIAGKLSASQQHEVERLIAENEFISDAVEGLQKAGAADDLHFTVEQLNRELRKKLTRRKTPAPKRRFKDSPWAYVAIVIIIALVVLSYLIINRLYGS